MTVSDYFDSLNENESKIAKEDKKKWEEDLKQRQEDWAKMVRLDAGLEESLFIMNDMITDLKGQKVSWKKLMRLKWTN